jgi:hypothetical protein
MFGNFGVSCITSVLVSVPLVELQLAGLTPLAPVH